MGGGKNRIFAPEIFAFI